MLFRSTYNFFFDVGQGETQVEVLIPAPGSDSGVARYLARRGPGLHHLCYACEDVHAEAERLRAVTAGMVHSWPAHARNAGSAIAPGV